MTESLTTHRLTRGQFAEIAAGAGSGSTLRVLAESQLSKRLLLLWAVRSHASVAAATECWALLDTAIDRSLPAVHRVLARPFVDAWATAVLRSEVPEAGAKAYLAGVAAAAAFAAGLDFDLPVTAAAADVVLPGLGRLAAGPAGGHLRSTGGELAFVAGGSTTVLDPATDGWRAYHRTTDGALEIDDIDPFRAVLGHSPIERLERDRLLRLADLLGAATEIIERDHPRYRDTIEVCLRTVVPVHRPAIGSVSSSSRQAFGAIATSWPATAADLALTMIHETQHVKLGALLDLVELIDPKSDRLFHAPWRTDPRPAGQLLQGTYAHAAVAEFWRVRRTQLTGAAHRAAEYEFAYWREQTRRAARDLAQSDSLTELGETFVAVLTAGLDDLTGDVAADAGRTVSITAVANGVIWRLRRHAVDTGVVDRLTSAYRRRSPCPELPPPTVVPAPAGPTEMDNTLVRRIRTAAAAGTVTVRAEDAGRLSRRLHEAPDDGETWAMLALAVQTVRPGAAGAIEDRPELLSAMLRSMVDEQPDAVDVAAWLARGAATPMPHTGV